MNDRHPMREQGERAHSLRDFLTVIFRHKHKIMIVFLATMVTVIAGTFVIRPTYEANSSLMVKFGREYVYRSEVDDTRPSISFNREQSINSEIEILKSRDLVERVIKSVGVEKVYPQLSKSPPSKMTPLEAAILRFEKKLSVEAVKKSNVIQVSFQHKDPVVAALMVNRLVEYFKDKHIKVFSDPNVSFMGKQLDIYRQKLKESEESLEKYKKEHGVYSIDEQRRLLLQQRVDLDTSLKNSENRSVELSQKLSSLKSQMKKVSSTIPLYKETERYKIVDDAKAKLLNLQLREQELLGRHNETSRLVVNIRKEISLVKTFIKDQEKGLTKKVRTGKNDVYQKLELDRINTQAELSSLKAKIRTIEEQIAVLDIDIGTLDQKEKELRDLTRERSINETNYKTYVKKMEEARITDDMNRQKMVNVSIIQRATVPVKPVKPRVLLNLLLGAILGMTSGLGLAFISEFLGQGMATPESAENQLGLTVLATVREKKEIKAESN